MRFNQLREAALALPVKQRAKLAHVLLGSLDGPADPDAEAAWIAEAKRRARELANGSVRAVDAEVVFRRVRRRLRQQRR